MAWDEGWGGRGLKKHVERVQCDADELRGIVENLKICLAVLEREQIVQAGYLSDLDAAHTKTETDLTAKLASLALRLDKMEALRDG